MKYFLIFLILIGFTGIVFAEEIPVEIQTPNDVDLLISGMVQATTEEQSPITIIIESNFEEVILISQVMPDDTDYFSLDVKRHGPPMG